MAIAMKAAVQSISHTLILRYEYPVVFTTPTLKIPFQLNALFFFSMRFLITRASWHAQQKTQTAPHATSHLQALIRSMSG
jgi:hypothetical protein